MTALGVEQREGEQPELVVIALDKSHRLGRGSRVKTYLTMAYSDVVSSLVTAAGLTASTDSSQPTFDYLLQVSSDLEFLNEMASRSGFDWWVDGSTLNFKKPASGTTVAAHAGRRAAQLLGLRFGPRPRHRLGLRVGPRRPTNPYRHSQQRHVDGQL